MPVRATVLEFGPNGAVTVDGERRDDGAGGTEDEAPAPRIVTSTKGANAYEDLAYEIALRQAGGRGPRAAGLDAVTFARLFTELVRAESGFDPQALSSKGAQGLGQLMPRTASLLGVSDPWDPAQNLDGAAGYLCAQLERFEDAHLALAAYNAGPHRVVQYGGIPPYRETRNYVATISAAVGLEPTADLAPTGTPMMRPSLATDQRTPSVWNY